MLKTILIYILFISSTFICVGQTTASKSFEDLKCVIENLNNVNLYKNGSLISYEVISVPKLINSSNITKDTMIMEVGKDYIFLKSSYLTLIELEDEIASIIENYKIIQFNNINTDKSEMMRNNLAAMQDTILNFVEPLAVTTISTDIVKLKITVLQKYQKKIGVNYLEYTFNKKTNRILKVKTIYNENHPLESLQMTYINFYLGNSNKYEKIVHNVFNNQKVQQLYPNYKIIDNR